MYLTVDILPPTSQYNNGSTDLLFEIFTVICYKAMIGGSL